MKIQHKSGSDTRDGNRMMLKNQAVEFKHHANELSNAVKKAKHVDAWVVAKAERATTDLSDITHYLDGQSGSYARGGTMPGGYVLSELSDAEAIDLANATLKDEIGDHEDMMIDSGYAARRFLREYHSGRADVNEDEIVDYFSEQEGLSDEAKMIIAKYSGINHDEDSISEMRDELMAVGYEFDYDDDMIPYSLRRVGEEDDDDGMFADGGNTKDSYAESLSLQNILNVGDTLVNAVGKKLKVYAITPSEYVLMAFGGFPSPWRKDRIHELIKTGEWALDKVMASGGQIDVDEVEKSAKSYAENPNWTVEKLEKEVKEYKALLKDWEAGYIKPSKVIGTGYKSSSVARKLADNWIRRQLAIFTKALELKQQMAQKAIPQMKREAGEIMVGNKIVKLKFIKRCCPSIKSDGSVGDYEYSFVDEEGNPYTGYGNTKEEALKSIEDYLNRASVPNITDDKGSIAPEQASIGDSALVVSENKLGTIVSITSGKYLLQFVDGTTKSYIASELRFIKDEDDYADVEISNEVDEDKEITDAKELLELFTEQEIEDLIGGLEVLVELGDEDSKVELAKWQRIIELSKRDKSKMASPGIKSNGDTISVGDTLVLPKNMTLNIDEFRRKIKNNEKIQLARYVVDEIYKDALGADRITVRKGRYAHDTYLDKIEKLHNYFKNGVMFASGGMMAKGGATFEDKVTAISGRLEGTVVPRRLRSEYGRRYNKEESKKAAQRIAGAMRKKGY